MTLIYHPHTLQDAQRQAQALPLNYTISNYGEQEQAGGIITPQTTDPRLRWNMTAVATLDAAN